MKGSSWTCSSRTGRTRISSGRSSSAWRKKRAPSPGRASARRGEGILAHSQNFGSISDWMRPGRRAAFRIWVVVAIDANCSPYGRGAEPDPECRRIAALRPVDHGVSPIRTSNAGTWRISKRSGTSWDEGQPSSNRSASAATARTCSGPRSGGRAIPDRTERTSRPNWFGHSTSTARGRPIRRSGRSSVISGRRSGDGVRHDRREPVRERIAPRGSPRTAGVAGGAAAARIGPRSGTPGYRRRFPAGTGPSEQVTKDEFIWKILFAPGWTESLREQSLSSPWEKSPASAPPLREGNRNPPRSGDAGHSSHRQVARIASAIRSTVFRGEGEPSPHSSPAALRAVSVPG